MLEISIRRIERNVMRSLFADGLWEMFAGYLVLHLALIPRIGDLGLGKMLGSLVWLPMYWLVFRGVLLLKKRVIAPRIGGVRLHQLSAAGRPVLSRGIMAVLVLVNLVFAAIVFSAGSPGTWNRTAVLALFMLIAFSGASLKLRVPRFMAFGWLCSAAVMAGEWLYRTYGVSHHGIPLAMGICGGMILVSGGMRMVVFLRCNPRTGMGKMG